MIKRVIDEKIKQNQDLKEWFEKLGLSNETIVHLILILTYLCGGKEKTNAKTSN